MSFASDLHADAVAYVAAHFGVDVPHTISDSALRASIDSTYLGGWHAYEAAFRRAYRDLTSRKVVTETETPTQLRARVAHVIGRRLREYDEVVSASTDTDGTVRAVVRFANVTRLTRRDRIDGYELFLYVVHPDSRIESVSVPDNSSHEVVHYGRVRTPDYVAAQNEAYETCYRPGTESAPMAGWVARAGMSDADAHPETARPTRYQAHA